MTIELDRLELFEIHLPLREPFRISSGVMTTRRILLLRLESSEGVVAWSECVADATPNYSPETIDTVWLAITEWLAPRLLGTRLESPEAADVALRRNIRGHEMAIAGLEMGTWGLFATAEGVSLSQRLGGTRERIGTGISLGIQETPAELVERAASAHAAGYQKVKIKIKPGQDIDYIRAAREALPDAHLMADANNAYSLDDVAHLQQLDAFDLMMIEQPLAHDDVRRHGELQRALSTPVCLDESITSLDRAQDMVALGAGRIINIKPGRVGGFSSSKAIHDFAEQNEIPVWCGGMLESGVGRAYNVALASLPNFSLPGDLSPSERYWKQDVVSPEWTMDAAGWVDVPTGPGLGVEVDEGRIRSMAARALSLTA